MGLYENLFQQHEQPHHLCDELLLRVAHRPTQEMPRMHPKRDISEMQHTDWHHPLTSVAQWAAPTTAHGGDRCQTNLDNATRMPALPKHGDHTPHTSTQLHFATSSNRPTYLTV
jgi:hypothetical protein